MGEKINIIIRNMMMALVAGAIVPCVQAQTVNNWRGDASGADWNDRYKWTMNHPPTGNEAAHFRDPNSVISINSTVQLDNGMHLYGQELLLKGNGNINLYSAVPHQRTVNIPASASGFANLTLTENLSLNGRISLSAKGFGTSASKGTITLKNRSTITGDLAVGNQGTGSGQVFVKDNSTFRITGLELSTKAKQGGMTEIHILGGTVRIETKQNPFQAFLSDPGRRIIIGSSGTLRIESDLPIKQKKAQLKKLITNNQLIAAPGCHMEMPIIQTDILIARAKPTWDDSSSLNTKQLLAAIDALPDTPKAANPVASPNTDVDVKVILSADLEKNGDKTAATETKPRLSGYIAFFGTALLAFRRSPEETKKK